MAINRYHEMTCDGCDAYCDLDPISIVGNTTIPATIKDPKKIKELTYFWLCGDCSEFSPTAKDFFVDSYFTEDELFCCERCDKFIPEDELDGLGDVETLVCGTCAPELAESEA
jgi:hypothetical protein